MAWDRRYLRHARALASHATPHKLANIIRAEAALKRRAEVSEGFPYLYFVDVCNTCDLRCGLCPSRPGEFKRSRGMIRLPEYREVLGKIEAHAIEVSLHNWGEPLLNPDIFAIVEHTRSRNVGTNLSSNLNGFDQTHAGDLVSCGLEYLVVSLDGATPETYERYRVRGDFDRTLENLRAIVDAKNRLGSAHPIIEWQFLVMKHNEHEMAAAQQLAEDVGADFVRFASAGLPFEAFGDTALATDWMPENPEYWALNPLALADGRRSFSGTNCYYLYRSMTINPGGGVAPCCVLYDESHDFGNLGVESLAEIWNNQHYRDARRHFAGGSLAAKLPCSRCLFFEAPVVVGPGAAATNLASTAATRTEVGP